MITHAFNKDCDPGDKGSDELLKKMPEAAKCFCYTEFAASLEFDPAVPVLYIGHLTDRQMNEVVHTLEERESIVIRCSTVGRSESEYGHSQRGSLCILELRPKFCTVRREDWESIVALVTRERDTPRQIVAGSVPRALRLFFENRTSREYLNALSILCQGYLAVHANPESGEPDLPDQYSGPTQRDSARSALEKMGWKAKWLEDKGRDCLSGQMLDKNGRLELQGQVRTRSWWANIFTGVDLKEELVKEWWDKNDPAKGEGEAREGLVLVENLADAIVATNGDEIEPKTVADAYAAIADCLGR